ncbi:DUF1642 domain-containing protein [Enterococcus faecium]|uniref:DUF1642 domain-containing protein n=1 Tax=Enterococcus faecium TaxID=1352 RepID=UPI002883F537|nr:DUF1642 domain-containing protein [Enterococcus faecium]MDT0255623.1 DUF1642 domain-containing protein [Enterococcus faecium]
MNKQELIDKLASLVGSIEDFKGISTFHDGKYAGLEHALELIKQLDEPQKPVVPKFVAEWFEKHKRNLDYSIWEYIREWDQQDRFSDFHQWFDKEPNNPIETLIRMKDGYEVEKEPLYYVKLPVVYFNHLDLETYLMKDDRGNITIADNNDFDDMKFTESEIKAIDERYWAFAVPVEEVVER